jgi:hypothetical protein
MSVETYQPEVSEIEQELRKLRQKVNAMTCAMKEMMPFVPDQELLRITNKLSESTMQ